jgi:hypothetical protein
LSNRNANQLLARNLFEEPRRRESLCPRLRSNTTRLGDPARVKGTNEKGGVLRIDYPGYSGEETLQTITWTEFFKGFEKNQLAFVYEDETKSGEQSRFSKLVSRRKDN